MPLGAHLAIHFRTSLKSLPRLGRTAALPDSSQAKQKHKPWYQAFASSMNILDSTVKLSLFLPPRMVMFL
jgi:hypothetical protein